MKTKLLTGLCLSLLSHGFAAIPDSTFLPANGFISLAGGPQTPVMQLAGGFRFQFIIRTGETLPDQSTMRANFDFTGFVPLYAADSGVLSINHELAPGGVTMMNMHFDIPTKRWIRSNESVIDFSSVLATGGNCSGTVTPWNTVITCEEGILSTDFDSNGYNDGGWAIEIDPKTRTIVNNQKLWALGNFKHENAVVSANRRTAYEGADSPTGYLFKFVADSAENLSSGKLYAYKGPKNGNGNWVELKNSTPEERNNVNLQCDTLGATTFAGIEDVEIGYLDSLVYLAVKGSSESCVYRFLDSDPLTGGSVQNFEVFVGGPGVSYDLNTANGPVTQAWGVGNDNLAFDDQGNLFVLQDGSQNHLWVIGKNHTQVTPDVKIFLQSPAGSEPTGITFSPDFRFLFMSFQHPSASNSSTYVSDINGDKISFDKDIALVIGRNEVWGLACENNVSINSTPTQCCFYSSGQIESHAALEPDKYLELNAATNIELNPGFISPAGSTFTTFLDGCSNLN